LSQLEQELAATVQQLEAEEAATATRAERAADPALAAAARAAAVQQQAAPPPAAPAEVATLASLPPEVITPILVLGLDVAVKRLALYLADEKTSERYALSADERKLMVEVWLPAVRHYSSLISVHPLALGIAGTISVYGMKALPEGGLEAVLGGTGQGPAPRAPSSTAELLQPAPAPTTPQADPVLEAARQHAAALELERAKKAGAVQ
jgi:hypothetical protein